MGCLQLTACVVDFDAGEIRRENETLSLTPNEAALLRYLARHSGELIDASVLGREVLGISERVESRALGNCVRRLRQKIERDPGEPEHLQTIRGRGFRLVLSEDAASSGRPGRDVLLDALDARARRGWITLVGPGGVGKTHIGRALAAKLDDLEPIWVDLGSAADPDDAMARVALALGLGGSDMGALVAASLADRPRRLFLDGAERSGIGPALSRWSLAAPSARFIVTSLSPLGAVGEDVATIEPLPPKDAEELLRALARRELPRNIGALLPLLGGIPLAIEIAAAHLEVLDIDTLSAWLSSSSARSSLDAVIERTMSALPESQRRALLACATFGGSFDAVSAAQVIGAPDALELLGELKRRAMLCGEPGALSVLDPVRRWLLSRADRGDVERARAAHARWLLDRIEPAVQSPDPALPLAELRAALSVGDPVLFARLLRCMEIGCGEWGAPKQRSDALDRALSSPLPSDLERELTLLRAIARARAELPCADDIESLVASSDPLTSGRARLLRAQRARAAGDLEGAARDLSEIGALPWPFGGQLAVERSTLAFARGELRSASASGRGALEEAEERGDDAIFVGAAMALALAERAQGRDSFARALYLRAKQRARERGLLRAAAVACSNLGQIALQCGEPEARASLAEALALSSALGLVRLEAHTALNLAMLDLIEGRPEAIIIKPIVDRLERGGWKSEADAYRWLEAMACCASGDGEGALRAFALARAFRPGEALEGEVLVLACAGEIEAAERCLARESPQSPWYPLGRLAIAAARGSGADPGRIGDAADTIELRVACAAVRAAALRAR